MGKKETSTLEETCFLGLFPPLRLIFIQRLTERRRRCKRAGKCLSRPKQSESKAKSVDPCWNPLLTFFANITMPPPPGCWKTKALPAMRYSPQYWQTVTKFLYACRRCAWGVSVGRERPTKVDLKSHPSGVLDCTQ